MMKNNNYNNWDDKCNTWSTDESEEGQYSSSTRLHPLQQPNKLQQSQRATTACMSKDVEGLSIKRLNTARKIKMYMRKAEDRCLVKLEEPLDETSSSSSSSTHETETSTGLQNTIPNGSSLTTHGSRNSNYDNQEYWKGILQTNGGVGPTGSGKSRLLWEQYPNHYHKQLNKWWDGYNDEETVAIEEWCPKNECTGSQLKIWADRYPFSAQIKGGTLLKIRPTKLIVLSNYEMEECFPNEADLLPLKRRFTIKRFI